MAILDDDNTPPTFAESSYDQALEENTGGNRNLDDPIVATDVDGHALTYSLEGDHALMFGIDETRGQVRTQSHAAYDHERRPQLTVRVKAEDSRGATALVPLQVMVEDLDEPPAQPNPPSVWSVSGNKTTLSVRWRPPSNTGPSITGYALRYRESLTVMWSDGPENLTRTTATLTELAEDTEYEVQVMATNDEGDGPWSSSGRGRTDGSENNAATGRPVIEGTPWVDRVLTVNTESIADADGLTAVDYDFQWVRVDGDAEVDLPNATGTAYRLVAADQGKRVKVWVDFTDDAGNREFLVSNLTSTVLAADGSGGTGGTGGGGGGLNRAPRVDSEIDAKRLEVGGTVEFGLSGLFSDPDSDRLRFSASSGDPRVVEAEVHNDVLTLNGVGGGTTTVTVRATDPGGRSATQQFSVMVATRVQVPFFPATTDSGREGFLRVINHSQRAGTVDVAAIDDAGTRYGPVPLSIGADQVRHFNATDLSMGNADRNLPRGVGTGSGDWRLELESALDLEALAYVRTADGFVTSMYDVVPGEEGEEGETLLRVVFFNPGENPNQVSHLRLVNSGDRDANVTIRGIDDAGAGSAGSVELSIAADSALSLTAAQLESGGKGFDGALGDGAGKWRLRLTADAPIGVMSLLESPTGNFTNLSALPPPPDADSGEQLVPLFPSSMDARGLEGFVRVINRSLTNASVEISPSDDSSRTYDPVSLAVPATRTVHFNSGDLDTGAPDKGLDTGIGAGEGSWVLALTEERVEVLSYIRTMDGFVTSMHERAPLTEDGYYRVAFFNPGSNPNQVSRLRLINTGSEDATVSISVTDDAGAPSEGVVELTVPAGTASAFTAREFEEGGEGFAGSFGDGDGKWRLKVRSDQPIFVMSLLENPTGHLTNLSPMEAR